MARQQIVEQELTIEDRSATEEIVEQACDGLLGDLVAWKVRQPANAPKVTVRGSVRNVLRAVHNLETRFKVSF